MTKIKPEMVDEILNQLSVKVTSSRGQKILSVIGSCRTNSQLESCKHWVERVVDNNPEKVYYKTAITLRFGQIEGPKFDV